MLFVTTRRETRPFTPIAATDYADAYAQLINQARQFNFPVPDQWTCLETPSGEDIKRMVADIWGSPYNHVKITAESDLPEPVRELRRLVARINQLTDQLDQLRGPRDQAIHQAVTAGISQSFLADVTGLPASTIAKSYNEVEKTKNKK